MILFANFSPNLQNWTVFKVVGAGSSVESAEGNTSSSERRNITEVIPADCLRFIAYINDP